MSSKLKFITVIIGITLSCNSLAQTSSLRSMTDNIFSSYTSSGGPDNYQSVDGRQVYTGGAYSLRFRQKDIKIINMEPPSFSASCNGLDFFAGSLSFASRDELIQAGRNIAAGATVYAFKLALNSVCSSCNSIMTSIQNAVDRINELANVSCSDTVKALENINPLTDKDGFMDGMVKSYSDTTFANPDKWFGLPPNSGWLDGLAEAGLTTEDLVEKNNDAALMTNDPGFLAAYSTQIPNILFPWLDDESAQAATWSVLSEGTSCPNEKEKIPDGSWCGLEDKYHFSMLDFVYGRTAATSGAVNLETELQLPLCKETKTLSSPKSKVLVCVKPDNGPMIIDGEKAEAIEPIFLETVFGKDAVDGEKVDFKIVCENESIKKTNSLFSNVLSFNSNSLNQTQAYLASIIGTDLTRDLYMMDANGKYLTNPNEETECGKLAALVLKRVQRRVAMMDGAMLTNLTHAKSYVEGEPKLSSKMKLKYLQLLDNAYMETKNLVEGKARVVTEEVNVE